MLVYLTCGAYLEHCSIGCILLLFHLIRSVIGPENSRVEGGGGKPEARRNTPPPSQAKTRTNHRRIAHVNLGSGIGTRPKRWGVEWGVGSRGQFFHQYTIHTALHALFKMITQSFVMTWFVLQFPHLKVVVNSCICFQALLVIKFV